MRGRSNEAKLGKRRGEESAKLVAAHDQELIRIAQELHDDIGASLGVLGIELLQAGKPVPGSPEKVYPGIPEIYEKMQGIAKKISHISHRLDPPALKYLGMAQAIKTECRVFSEDARIPAVCSCHDIPEKLDQTIGFSIIRVLQEALRNAGKHSGATKVEVEAGVADAVFTLTVRDDGKGFDVDQGRFSPGLGIACMQGRLWLIGGDLEIRSRPGCGTEVTCRVPLDKAK